VLDERPLERMKLLPLGVGEPLHGRDLRPVMRHREGQAPVRLPAVDQDRAGAALAVVAALLGAGQVEVLTQHVEQRGGRVDRQRVLTAVDPQAHVGQHRRLDPGLIVWHEARLYPGGRAG
jgi:hypothetical protein